MIAVADPFAFDRQIRAANVLAYLGSATLVLFSDSYFYGGSRLVAWAALSFFFIAVAWFARLELFHTHSILLAGFAFLRALGYELQAGGRGLSIPGEFSPAFYVSVVAAILFAAQAFAFALRARYAAATSESSDSDGLSRIRERSEQIYFFLPMLLVTVLIANEVSFGRVTIGWGIEAVVAFLFALVVGERSFRLAGLSLLLICVAKIGLLDVWRQRSSDRYVTLIILGVALLLVSYLYTRYAEAIRRYL